MYPAQAEIEMNGIAKCESCDQPNETLVATLDGLQCADCMSIGRAEAEFILNELPLDVEASRMATAVLQGVA